MTNPIKGEVGFDWRGQSWKMVLNTNARCEMEAAFGRGIGGMALDAFGLKASNEAPTGDGEDALKAQMAANIQLRYVRGFMFHGLRQFHPDVTINDVGFMIDDLGAGEALNLVDAMFAVSEPEPAAGATSAEGKAKPVRKPKG